MKRDAVQFFDTTLRDGEQSPGAAMSIPQKRDIAEQLERLGVNVIEAGFPVSSPEQLEGVKAVARDRKQVTVAALSRALEKDIDIAAEAIKEAAHPRIHTFIATSAIHMEHKLNMKPEQVIDRAVSAVAYARNLCAEVEFSAEDATRSDVEFLCNIFEKVINSGATIINIPDTVGYATPEDIFQLFTTICNKVPNIDKAVVSAHCHDDLGLGVANTVSAVRAGARQVEVTINGIGERAGNAALEEVAMALQVRSQHYGVTSSIISKEIYKTSRLVSGTIGFHIPRNKAIVGENAFSHEAGIHQHGMLANRNTYEIMTPESVGRQKSNIVLGRHSGMHGFKKRLSELDIQLTAAELDKAYERFLQVADKKREVYNEDLLAIADESTGMHTQAYVIKSLQVMGGSGDFATASIAIRHNDTEYKAAAIGDGPVDAIFLAIEQALNIKSRLTDFVVHALTPGKQAMGEVTVNVEIDGKSANGNGSSTDILHASAKAYLSACYRLLSTDGRS